MTTDALLTLAFEMPSLAAAREKLPWEATSENVLRSSNPSIFHPVAYEAADRR